MIAAEALIRVGCPAIQPRPGVPVLDLDPGKPDEWPLAALAFLTKHVRWGSTPAGVVSTREHEPALGPLLDVVADYYDGAAQGELTVTTKARDWALNFCRTLKRSPGWVTTIGQPLHGQTAFILAAGTALDRVGDLLPELPDHGYVIATNSGARAAMHYGCAPDLVVCVESKDLATHLHGVDAPVALAASAHPANWGAARAAVAIPTHDTSFVPYQVELGVPALPYGVSAFNAAISLAYYWGAARIVLVGYTMGYVDGRVYARGSPFADLTYELAGDTVVQHGTSKRPPPVALKWRKGWRDGPDVASTDSFDSEFDWVERAARRLSIWNTSIGGVHVPHAYEMRLDAMLGLLRHERVIVQPPAPIDATRVVERICNSAVLYLANPRPTIPHSFPLLQAFAAPVILQQHRYTDSQRNERLIEALTAACNDILEVLDGGW